MSTFAFHFSDHHHLSRASGEQNALYPCAPKRYVASSFIVSLGRVKAVK